MENPECDRYCTPILAENPDLCAKLKQYRNSQLAELHVELVHTYLYNTITPRLVHDVKEACYIYVLFRV